MISATDALLLPGAQLTEAEQTAAALLEVEISAYIETHMERRGCYDFKTAEMRGNVIADVNQRIKQKNWDTQWNPVYRQNKDAKQQREHAGWTLVLQPTDEAYRQAEARKVN